MVSINPELTFLTVDQPVENNLEPKKEVMENRECNLLTCTVCFEKFSSLIKLQRHYIKHVNNKPFQCNECEKSFFTEAALQKHIKLHIKKSFSSPICSNRFTTQTEHHLSNHDFSKLVCNVCFERFPKTVLLRRHEKTHTLIPEGSLCYICVVCKANFASRQNLEDHLNEHERGKEFTCKECNATFFFSYLLQNHTQIHSAKEYCNICSESFQNKLHLHAHEKIHLKKQLSACNVLCFTCELCNATFPFKADLESHFNDDHDGNKRYSCPGCDKTFFFSYLCRQHKFQCPKKLNTEKHSTEIHCKEKKHACPLCDKQFAKKWSLKQHCLTHTNQEKYACNFCKTTFTRMANLERHYQVHTGKKQFKCDKCDSAFTRKTKLRNHLKLHEEDEIGNFSCYLCDKTFISKHRLRQHTRYEHPEVRSVYVCEVCGKVCKTQSAFCVHYKQHTGEKRYKCKFCDKRFSQKKHLFPHHKSKHPDLDIEIDLPFKCAHCNQAYLLKRGLTIHHKKFHSSLELII